MKKIMRCLGFLCCILLLTTATVFASASDTTDMSDLIGKDIEIIYENIEMGEDNAPNTSISNDVSFILEKKREVVQYVQRINNISEHSFEISTELESKNKMNGYDAYLYNVVLSYQQVGFERKTTVGFQVLVKVDTKCEKIVDFYELFNPFDEKIRNEEELAIDPINVNARMARKVQTFDQNFIQEKTIEYKNAILDQKMQLETEVQVPELQTKEAIEPMATSTFLNSGAMKTWALNNCTKKSPNSGGSGVSYYDFSLISGNYDCTNFVSHALLAGGAKPYKPSVNSDTGWYYNNLNDRSPSWTGVSFLYDFLTTNTTKGPGGITTVFTTNPATHSVGDILQFKFGNTWMHSTIITGYDDESTMTCSYPAVTGRASADNFQDNWDARRVYPGNPRRIIRKLRNYS